MTPQQQRLLAKRLEGADLNALAAELALRKNKDARESFLPFVRRCWNDFVQGRHHAIMSDVFERVEQGKCKRVIINLPPRHTKSRFTSVLFPAWYLGKHPNRKVMQCSHTASLALDFGRDLRNLVNSDDYKAIF